MNCPNCGSKNHPESEVWLQCGTQAAGRLPEKAAAERSTRVLLEQYYAGRRNTIVGVLLLCGACFVLLVLMSKGLPTFLAFLWTCWMFFGGMIAFAEGFGRWLSSPRWVKALARAISRPPGVSRTDTDSDQAEPGQGASKVPSAEVERPIEGSIRTLLDKARSG